MSSEADPNEVHNAVRNAYAEVVTRQASCCTPDTPAVDAKATSQAMGYTAAALASVPVASNLGVGCGNPTALAGLQAGQTALDLGSGAGLDAFLAAQQVGPTGQVIGVDMTPEMLESSRKSAVDMGVHGYVEFRHGFIESLPVASESVDVVLSNCVINLSPDKPAVFREAFRVLRSGGGLAVSDIVLSEALPEGLGELPELYAACVSGALVESEYLGAIRAAGFVDVAFTRSSAAPMFLDLAADPMVQAAVDRVGQRRAQELAATVWSYKITGRKP